MSFIFMNVRRFHSHPLYNLTFSQHVNEIEWRVEASIINKKKWHFVYFLSVVQVMKLRITFGDSSWLIRCYFCNVDSSLHILWGALSIYVSYLLLLSYFWFVPFFLQLLKMSWKLYFEYDVSQSYGVRQIVNDILLAIWNIFV